ncbi:hypothetical protein FBG13_09490 [Cobetia marina]|jgi:hypothetical protein|uniref:Uncharacterized protein n=1 Tax=Cobetia marina TaxID=28258 RepID=A0ABU9GIN1_COBMA|nr:MULTISPECIES: hypothetical protein [Cobetia]AOM00544.1 hypothetical protein BFX80_03545 [Cobetia marina]AZV30629.1 hypothetical protein CU110_03480 [Cobetia sp. ICG0124]MDA5564656.1 hypothetical protein [Cobetia sp. MMG027]MDH2291204.1 hypothetical protein [Cobetia sp. 10Alg 146]MDH2372864.1 hypothetical protein [Cobetia sp. 3AK]
MTVTLIWLVSFAALFMLCLNRWEGSLGATVKRILPDALSIDSGDRYVWGAALAVLGATFIVNPISMLMALIMLALIAFIGGKLICWGMSKVKMH